MVNICIHDLISTKHPERIIIAYPYEFRKEKILQDNIPMMMKVTKMIEKCPMCGDDTVGNGSKFVIEDKTFERTCRECGWRVTGKVKNNEVIVESDNRKQIDR